jgi:hypothetical protein
MAEKKSNQPRLTSTKKSLQKNVSSSFLQQHWKIIGKWLLIILGYIFIWLIASYLFYRRFPDNYRQPNFYAEDGQVFAHNIITQGFWHSFFETFNGYYIWGIYLIEKIGFIINALFFSGQFANLPRSFALASYGFLGFMATLPIILFRRYIKFIPLLLIGLLVLYVPLRGSDYAIIGTIGNLKFAFLYIAFLLLCYRHLIPKTSKKIYLIDLGLLLCAYTDITVYIMLLFALVRYGPKFNFRRPLVNLKELIVHDRTFQSLIGLGVLLLPQLYIIKRDGVASIPGYLTNGFNFHRTIEIFISRSYLYDIISPANKSLDNGLVVAIFVIIIALAWWGASRYRQFFVFGILSILAGTLLFVVKRTGVSDYFIGYKAGGPDQFFYSQNWIFSFIIVIVFAELINKLKPVVYKVLAYIILFSLVFFYLAPNASIYGLNTFMENTVGNIYSVSKQDCKTSSKAFNLAIYPTKGWIYRDVSRQQLCTSAVVNYEPQELKLGLAPYNNNYRMVANTRFLQTFVSPRNNLNGLYIYFSTFLSKVVTPYTLKLYNNTCKIQLASVGINTNSLSDNSLAMILFPKITNSQNKSYCFTVVSNRTPSSPLAVQLSVPNSYASGTTTLNGKSTTQDVVFALHYK